MEKNEMVEVNGSVAIQDEDLIVKSMKSLNTAKEEFHRILQKSPHNTQSDLSAYDVRALLRVFNSKGSGMEAVYECIGLAFALGFRRGRKYGARQAEKKER